jgi:hypothetical protein
VLVGSATVSEMGGTADLANGHECGTAAGADTSAPPEQKCRLRGAIYPVTVPSRTYVGLNVYNSDSTSLKEGLVRAQS